MPSQIGLLTDYFVAGRKLVCDLLREVPESTDPSTWLVCNWDRYHSVEALPEILNDLRPKGLFARLQSIWHCNSGSWTIKAIGVTFNNQPLGVYQVIDGSPNVVNAGQDFAAVACIFFENWDS